MAPAAPSHCYVCQHGPTGRADLHLDVHAGCAVRSQLTLIVRRLLIRNITGADARVFEMEGLEEEVA